MSQTVDASKQEQERLAKEAAEKAAAEQAIKDEIARQENEIKTKFQEYTSRQTAIQNEIQNLPKESYQSGVEIRRDAIGKSVPVAPGASKGKLIFEDQVFPVYSTRYTPESETRLKELQTELATLQQQHQASLSDPRYKELSEQATRTSNIAEARSRLESLKQTKAGIEAQPPPAPAGKSGTARRAAAQAGLDRANQLGAIQSEISAIEGYLATSTGETKPTIPIYQEQRFSSPSGAIGYNPMTGRVELGAGDIRGTVVSQSAVEDRMDLERIKKEAGYVGKATIDPRIGMFKTVDAGIMTPGFKAQPSVDILRQFGQDIVTPQRKGKSILTDQPDSKYANPDFVSREKQLLLDQAKQPGKQYQVNLYEVPQMYELEIGDKKVRITAAEAKAYADVFDLEKKLYQFRERQYYAELGQYAKDLKAQGVSQVPVLTQGKTVFVPVQNLVAEMKKISARDPEARITQSVSLTESLQVTDKPLMQTRIEQTPAGTKRITVATPPPAPPKYELLSFIPLSIGAEASELKGIGTFKEQGQALTTIATQKTEESFRVTPGRTAYEDLIKQVEKESRLAGERGDYLGQIASEIKKDALIGFGSAADLMTKYLVEPTQEFQKQQTLIPYKPLALGTSLTGIGVEGTVASAAKLAPIGKILPIPRGDIKVEPQQNSTKVIEDAAVEAGQTFESDVIQPATSYVQTYGPGTIVGAIIGGVMPDTRLVPLRVVRVAPVIGGAPKVLATSVKLGYGTGVSRFQIGRISETGKFFAGVPEPSRIPSITKMGFTGPAPRGGYAITEDVSGYMYRPKTLDYLVEQKTLRPDEAALIKATERRLKLTAKYPDVILRKDLPAQPVRSLEAGAAETGTFFKGTEKEKLGLYGSVTEQFYMESKYLEQSRDVDIHITGRGAGEKATRIATDIAEEMQKKTRPERQFFVKTKIDDVIDLATGKPTGKKEVDRVVISVTTEAQVTKPKILQSGEGVDKVSELIVKSPQAATKEGFEYTKMSEVFGMKVPDKMVKAETIIPDAYTGTQKITVFRRQELRRSSAMLEVQAKDKGGIVRPDPGREKEFTKVVGQTMTRAKQAERMGRPKEAAELRAYAEQVKAFAKERGLWREGLKVDDVSDDGGIMIPESILSKAAREVKEKAPRPIIAPKEDQEVSPTPPEYSRVSAVSKSFDSGINKSAVSSAISRLESRSAISRIESKISESKTVARSGASKSRAESRTQSDISKLTGSKTTPSRAAPSRVTPSRAGPSRAVPSRATPSLAALTGGSIAAMSKPSVTPSRTVLPRTAPIKDIIKPTPRIPVIPIDKLKQKTDKERERAEKERADFIGQAKVSEVVGFGRRGDITYGRVLTAKLAARDVRASGKRSGSFVRSRSISLLDRTKPAILKKDKKEKEFRL